MIGDPIPRIARLMALAIRFDGLLPEGKIRDYAELARRGRLTRSPHDADHEAGRSCAGHSGADPFLPPINGLNERNLRRIVSTIDWREQRRMFLKFAAACSASFVRPPTPLGRFS
jgi:hypothetical protein